MRSDRLGFDSADLTETLETVLLAVCLVWFRKFSTDSVDSLPEWLVKSRLPPAVWFPLDQQICVGSPLVDE